MDVRHFWRTLFPPRLSDEFVAEVARTTQETTIEAQKVADTFERISNTAAAVGIDPLAVLIHEVKGASFHRQIEEGG